MKSRFNFKSIFVLFLIVTLLIGCGRGLGDNSGTGSQETESNTGTLVAGSETESSMETESGTDIESGSGTEVPGGIPGGAEPPTESELPDLHEYDFTLCFAGDISLDEKAVTTAQLDKSENGIYGCISPELMKLMQDADLMCLNNEFTYSTNGAPLKGKAYTFRANPGRVAILQEMGVDVAQL